MSKQQKIEATWLAIKNKNKYQRVVQCIEWLTLKDAHYTSSNMGIHIQAYTSDKEINIWPTTSKMRVTDHTTGTTTAIAGTSLLIKELNTIFGE